MVFLRIFQAVFILVCLALISVGMLSSSSGDDAARASLFLMFESAGVGLIVCFISIIWISSTRPEGILAKLPVIMFLSLGIFTLLWTALSYSLGIHHTPNLSLMARAVKIGFGYLAGWLVSIIILFLYQQVMKLKRENESDEGEE